MKSVDGILNWADEEECKIPTYTSFSIHQWNSYLFLQVTKPTNYSWQMLYSEHLC